MGSKSVFLKILKVLKFSIFFWSKSIKTHQNTFFQRPGVCGNDSDESFLNHGITSTSVRKKVGIFILCWGQNFEIDPQTRDFMMGLSPPPPQTIPPQTEWLQDGVRPGAFPRFRFYIFSIMDYIEHRSFRCVQADDSTLRIRPSSNHGKGTRMAWWLSLRNKNAG